MREKGYYRRRSSQGAPIGTLSSFSAWDASPRHRETWRSAPSQIIGNPRRAAGRGRIKSLLFSLFMTSSAQKRTEIGDNSGKEEKRATTIWNLDDEDGEGGER